MAMIKYTHYLNCPNNCSASFTGSFVVTVETDAADLLLRCIQCATVLTFPSVIPVTRVEKYDDFGAPIDKDQ
jgi:hypothetical protein